MDAARRMNGRGVAGDLRIDWPALMAFKRSFTDPVPARQAQHYAARGIDAFRGMARLTGRSTIAVDGRTLEARHVVIATGAHPVLLGIPGAEHVATSDDFLELETLLARTVLIGGGYVAAEFARLVARAGSSVAVLQRRPRLLPRFDPDLVGWLRESFSTLGIEVRTGTAVTWVANTANGFLVQAGSDGGEQSVAANLVVHAAGRAPDLDALDLPAAGVQLVNGRIALNAFLQSVSNPLVYAAGDAAASGPPLTSVSSHDAKAIAGNLLDGNWYRPAFA